MKKRYVKPVISLCLIAALGIAGSLAYLTDETATVTNTFTAGADIGIALTETVDPEFTIAPAGAQAKDPFVTVDSESEAVYIYVDVIESLPTGLEDADATFDEYITYAVSDDWEEVTGFAEESGITTYVYTGGAVDNNPVSVSTGTNYYVLVSGDTGANGEVSYPTTVTTEMLNELEALATADDENVPTLSFVAYAVQADNLKATDANAAFISYFKTAVK